MAIAVTVAISRTLSLHYIAVKYQNLAIARTRHGHGQGAGPGQWELQSALENLKGSLVQAAFRSTVLSLPDRLPPPFDSRLYFFFFLTFYVLRLIKLNWPRGCAADRPTNRFHIIFIILRNFCTISFMTNMSRALKLKIGGLDWPWLTLLCFYLWPNFFPIFCFSFWFSYGVAALGLAVRPVWHSQLAR